MLSPHGSLSPLVNTSGAFLARATHPTTGLAPEYAAYLEGRHEHGTATTDGLTTALRAPRAGTWIVRGRNGEGSVPFQGSRPPASAGSRFTDACFRVL